MTVLVQRMCNSRIDRNIVGGIRFESVRITIHDSKMSNDRDFAKYAEICTQLFPPSVSETDILAEIIHAGIDAMHMLAQMDKDQRKEDETNLQRKLRLMNENVQYGKVNE